VDLWRFRTEDGRGIRTALDWLLPFTAGEKEWQYPQITKLSGGQLAPLLRRAANAYGEPRYEQTARRLSKARVEDEFTDLLYPSHR
jgi:hypothetical protein